MTEKERSVCEVSRVKRLRGNAASSFLFDGGARDREGAESRFCGLEAYVEAWLSLDFA